MLTRVSKLYQFNFKKINKNKYNYKIWLIQKKMKKNEKNEKNLNI